MCAWLTFAALFVAAFLTATPALATTAVVNPETYSVEYVHTDALGSPVAYTGSNGSVLPGRSMRYEPYGTPTTTPRNGEPSYTGHQYDASTGLIYAQQRYYDPMLGRFLGVDPMAVDTGSAFNWNRYAYANNSPYKFTDPDGRSAIVTQKKDGSVLVQYPTKFIGPEANAQNIDAVKLHVAGMSGTYQVNGKQTAVQVEVTEVNKKFLGGTPRRARNEVTLLSGPTSGDSGRSWAEVGGNEGEIDVTDRLVPNGVAPHEFAHLGGVDDQYDKATGKSDPTKGNGIMNKVPGVVDSPTIEGIINSKDNVRREER